MSTAASPQKPHRATDSSLADLVDEITNRLHAGEEINVDDYAGQHPEWVDQLRKLLPTLQKL